MIRKLLLLISTIIALGVWIWGILLLSEGRPIIGCALIGAALVALFVVVRVWQGNWQGAMAAIVEGIAEILSSK
jgi:hypothetical protein